MTTPTLTTGPKLVPRGPKVAKDFVKRYYDALHEKPHRLHQFYKDSSVLSRPAPNGVMDTVTTMEAIKDKFLYMDGYKAEIKTIDGYLLDVSSGVIVLLTGWLIGKDGLRREFTQSVFLAPTDVIPKHSYYVRNDVFRFTDKNKLLGTNSFLVNCVDQGVLTNPLITEPGMKTPTSTPGPGLVPRSQLVGKSFVQQYYDMLHNCPDRLYGFYIDSSELSWPAHDGVMTSVTTKQTIKDKILSMDYIGYKAEIETVDAHLPDVGRGVILLIIGWLNGKENFRRKFVRSIYLAPPPNVNVQHYFVLIDVLRYVGETEAMEINHLPVKGTTDSA